MTLGTAPVTEHLFEALDALPPGTLAFELEATTSAGQTARDAREVSVTPWGVELTAGGTQSFGARGSAEVSTYFRDPDSNVIEIRHY